MGNIPCFEPKQEVFKVIFDYKGGGLDDLEIRKGDRLLVLQKNNSGWWFCRDVKTKKLGNVPSNFITPDNREVESQDWWIDCSRGEASCLLKMPTNQVGTFLVRRCKSSNHFMLSVKVSDADNDCLKHYRIRMDVRGHCYVQESWPFKTLLSLIKYYQSPNEHTGPQLTVPCPREPEEVLLKKLEVVRNKVKLVKFLGSGSFGEVWKGKMAQKTVAVKKLKEDDMDLKTDLLKEAEVHNKMRHKRIVSLIGLCLTEAPFLLILEYMDKGSLRDELKKDKGKIFSFNILMGFAAQIVDGMMFIETKGFIHRDLKTANVLINSNNLVKIADFGLSKLQRVYSGNNDSLFPIRWSALEVFDNSRFSIKSDVWSFGVLLFELVTYGEVPYAREGIDSKLVYKFLKSGKRLQNPCTFHPSGFFKFICPDQLYNIMWDCWHVEPSKRPSFKDLACLLEQLE